MPYWFDDGHIRLPWSMRLGIHQMNLMCRLLRLKVRWCPQCGHPQMWVDSNRKFLDCPYKDKPTHKE